jgi:MscS family membrane protein
LISWIITLQYDTTVDQLKTIRNQIEDHIKKSEEFNTSIGIAVRVDKFSDSSIDMYVVALRIQVVGMNGFQLRKVSYSN